MYGEIKLNDPKGGELTIPMLANAATPIRFKMLFQNDLLTGIIGKDGNFDIDVVSKLAFLMAKQAAKVDMTTLNMDQYVAWLEDFDSMAFIDNAENILNLFIKSRDNTSKAKK
jgi:hypothetical protein